jgi:diaminohydroxyphosphoribosylaminopyrimidine deaminase/5-amino-6-(5-phosphoribosylamino)uracil reductase
VSRGCSRALEALRADGFERLLLEGGPTVHAAALRAGVVDQVMAFSAPLLLGGTGAPGPVGGEGVATVAEPLRLADVRVSRPGDDVLVEGFVDPAEPR